MLFQKAKKELTGYQELSKRFMQRHFVFAMD